MNRIAILTVVFCSVTALGFTQTTITVGQGGGYDYAILQTAINAAIDGDTVLVYPGRYYGNIHIYGKNIILRSTDPMNTATVAATIIDGNRTGSVVTLAGTETSSCVISGFTIRNGLAQWPYGAHGGGINGASGHNVASAVIEHSLITENFAAIGGGIANCGGIIRFNTITSNTATSGGGLYWCSGSIQDNTIVGNSAGEGGGFYGCNGTIQKNSITDNFARFRGGGMFYCDGEIMSNMISANRSNFGAGGLYSCNGLIRGNIISGNWAKNFGGGLLACHGLIDDNTIVDNSSEDGGGFRSCFGTIRNNKISGNSANFEGGALSYCGGVIEFNTIVGNSAEDGGGLAHCSGGITDCIVWQNASLRGGPLYDCSSPTYSCIENWSGGGEGNISADPLFTSGPHGEYYLSQTVAGQAIQSPCVDAGSTAALAKVMGERSTRVDGLPDVGIADMGYHYPLGDYPDLSSTLIRIVPDPLVVGRPFSFRGAVENRGSAASGISTWIEFWAIDAQAGWEEMICDPVLLDSMAPGAIFDLADITPDRFLLAKFPVGTYRVEVRADAWGALTEWYEDNNVARLEGVSIVSDLPNLHVNRFDFAPSEIDPDGGTTMTFSAEIQNNGSQPTTGGFVVEFRAGRAFWPESNWLPLCDPLTVAELLEPGEGVDLPTAPLLSLPLRPGYYLVAIRLDSLDEITERHEDDNFVWVTNKAVLAGTASAGVASRAWQRYR